MQKLNIAILSYRSAKYGGGQGVYIKDISMALSMMGHKVDVISGPPYPELYKDVHLIKLSALILVTQWHSMKQLIMERMKQL